MKSKFYIDASGFLMKGPEEHSTSIVEGLRCEWGDTDKLEVLIGPINSDGDFCGIGLNEFVYYEIAISREMRLISDLHYTEVNKLLGAQTKWVGFGLFHGKTPKEVAEFLNDKRYAQDQ